MRLSGVCATRVITCLMVGPSELIERVVGFAETACSEGILALEKELNAGDDPFLAQGVRLAVDGTEPDLIMDILETELQFIGKRHRIGRGLHGGSAIGLRVGHLRCPR